jgi:hypothetical protein
VGHRRTLDVVQVVNEVGKFSGRCEVAVLAGGVG